MADKVARSSGGDWQCPECGAIYFDAPLNFAQAMHDEDEQCDEELRPLSDGQ